MNRITLHGVGLEVAQLPGSSSLPPLVFLHEGLGCVAMWTQRGRHWPSELCAATGRAGWLISRRGYGQSDPVPEVRGAPRRDGFWHMGRHEPDYMHIEAWQVLPEILRHMAICNPVLVGHSDGATIALLHASRHPVSACVVMAPHVMVETASIRAIEQARTAFLDTSQPGHLRERLARYHADVDNAFWQWNDVWLSDAFQSFDVRDECALIQAPLLVVQGSEDEYGTLAQVQSIQHAIPHTQVCILHRCGHSPHRDQPDALTEAVLDFLHPSF